VSNPPSVTAGSMQDLALTAVEANPGGVSNLEVRAMVASVIKTDDVKRLSALVRGALFLLAKRGLVRVSGESWVRTYYPTGNDVERLPGRPAVRASFSGQTGEGWPVGASVVIHCGGFAYDGTVAKVTRHVVTLTDGSQWNVKDGKPRNPSDYEDSEAHIVRKT